jgi:hypothetical protein
MFMLGTNSPYYHFKKNTPIFFNNVTRKKLEIGDKTLHSQDL